MLPTLSSQLYLGIDAGATHTEAVYADESGFVLGKAALPHGANLRNAPSPEIHRVLVEAAMAALRNAVKNHPKRSVISQRADTIAIGMSGLETGSEGSRLRSFLNDLNGKSPLFHCGKLIFVSSGLVALKAGTAKRYGVSLTIGTGTSCYGLAADGREANAGGWGYLLGDQGSGYWIGRALLRQVMREFDGRLPATPIPAKVLAKLRLDSPSQLVDWSYARAAAPVRDIAQLSTIVNDPDLQNSYEINEIVNESVRDVSQAYRAVIAALGFESGAKLPVVVGGGLLGMSGNYADRVEQALRTITPDATISRATKTPAQGAIRLIQESVSGELLPRSALVVISPQPGNRGTRAG